MEQQIKNIEVDSAATSREELGNPVYPPARKVLTEHGVSCEGHRARQVRTEEYGQFDYIIAMDNANVYNLNRIFGGDPQNKIHLLSEYGHFQGEVADPWYTGNFDLTYRQIEDGCTELLKEILSK